MPLASENGISKYEPLTSPIEENDFAGGLEVKKSEFCDIAADTAGDIYAAGFQGVTGVVKYEASQFGVASPTRTTIDSNTEAATLAVDPDNGEVYIDEQSDVAVYTSGGTETEKFGTGLLLSGSFGVAVSDASGHAGDVYVSAGNSESAEGSHESEVVIFGPPVVTTSPTVTSVSPTSGSTSGGTEVTIKGTGFVKPATVTIGSAATNVKVISATEITATTAAHAAGPVEVVVEDTNGTSTGGPIFTYEPPPTVTSVSPASGSTLSGTEVTIKGTGFVEPATVTICGAATDVQIISPTEITATTSAPHAAGPCEVIVEDPLGTSTGGPTFTYETPPPPPPPTVTSVSPVSGSTAGGTKVTIKGTGFVSPATVTIGSAATNVKVISATEITATTAAHAAGPVEVVVEDANGTSTGGPTFTYTAGVTEYTFSVAVAGEGTVTSTVPLGVIECGTKCSHSFPEGEKVTLVEAPKPGYVFVGWIGCKGTQPTCEVEMTREIEVIAVFLKEGPAGPPGSQGAQGPPGPKGETGLQGEKGVAGTNGTDGQNGVPGPVGLQGPIGPTGGQGPAGAQGPAGQVELVTCKTVKKGKKSVQQCTTKLVSGTVKFTSADASSSVARATLSRHGVVYAAGMARIAPGGGRTSLRLASLRGLRAGHYTLMLISGAGRHREDHSESFTLR